MSSFGSRNDGQLVYGLWIMAFYHKKSLNVLLRPGKSTINSGPVHAVAVSVLCIKSLFNVCSRIGKLDSFATHAHRQNM